MGGETWFQVRRALYHERLRRPDRDTNRLMQRLFRPRRRHRGFQTSVLSRLYADARLTLTRRFEHSVRVNPLLVMRRPNFAAGPERVRSEINDLVRNVTRGKVEQLLPRGAIDRNTKLYVAEAFSIKVNRYDFLKIVFIEVKTLAINRSQLICLIPPLLIVHTLGLTKKLWFTMFGDRIAQQINVYVKQRARIVHEYVTQRVV